MLAVKPQLAGMVLQISQFGRAWAQVSTDCLQDRATFVM
jgi:hypothetical protein